MADLKEQDSSEQMESKVYALIGFMGAGKSTLGKAVARSMNRQFLDLDESLEYGEGMSIKSMFEIHGEAWFRQKEAENLRRVVEGAAPGAIISTGGGTPCFHDNMSFLLEHTTTILLDVSPKELARRLEPGRAHRPLISHLTKEGFLTWIEQKLEERNAWYRQSEVIIQADELSPAEMEQWIHYREEGFLR